MHVGRYMAGLPVLLRNKFEGICLNVDVPSQCLSCMQFVTGDSLHENIADEEDGNGSLSESVECYLYVIHQYALGTAHS
jgi:hypothetical protein